MICSFITIFDIFRNQYFYLGETILDEIPAAFNFIVSTFIIVEMADDGNEGMVYGLLTTVSNLGSPFSRAVGNGIFTYSGGTLTRATDADNRSPSGEAAASATNDIIVQGTTSDPNFAINKTYTFTANGISYTYGPTTNSDRDFYAGLSGLGCPGFSIGFHSNNGLTNATQITYTPQAVGDQLVIADTTGWDHVQITHGTYTSTGANAAGSELGGGAFAFVLEGQVWKDSAWIVSAPTGTANIGTDDITWVQFSRVSGIYANDGLAQDGNRIYVRTDGTTIHLDEDDIAVKSSTTQYQSLISDGDISVSAEDPVSHKSKSKLSLSSKPIKLGKNAKINFTGGIVKTDKSGYNSSYSPSVKAKLKINIPTKKQSKPKFT